MGKAVAPSKMLQKTLRCRRSAPFSYLKHKMTFLSPLLFSKNKLPGFSLEKREVFPHGLKGLIVFSFLPGPAWGKLDHLGSRNHAFFAGAGIAALAFTAFNDLEAAKASKGNLFTFGNAFGQNADGCIQELFGSSLGTRSNLGMNFIDNIRLRHGKLLP